MGIFAVEVVDGVVRAFAYQQEFELGSLLYLADEVCPLRHAISLVRTRQLSQHRTRQNTLVSLRIPAREVRPATEVSGRTGPQPSR